MIDGAPPVTLPGDPERRVLSERRQNGIPIDDSNWRALAELASQLNVEVP